ncbi:uncharacterized protein with NRDE domain [Limnobacter thiooxidans]|uniref:NRDE family protein n=1 Tax=Limnobacter thiooxidans TaxID=131080 RepID=A0AA86MB87_9BURK|nr:uncharacterized protein with NRDE domain [Limnobacter thiooxidans]BET26053.1 NRDE family protein [Limnobacter thiooxidans]
MCIAALALGVHPVFPFICVANRDEFHNRPTAPLQVWPVPGGFVLAGKDLQSGGSWLGLSSKGEFALLTNVRNAALNLPATAPSRGELVLSAIENGQGPTEEMSLNYAGFNLVHGNLNTLTIHCTSNQGLKLNNGVPFSVLLEPGIYSVSNGHLGAPWPKTRRLEAGLEHQLVRLNNSNTDRRHFEQSLLELLGHTGLAEDTELPYTGVPHEWEKMLSAVKIVSPLYGTRSSAVILMDTKKIVQFTEITFNPAGDETGRETLQIQITS